MTQMSLGQILDRWILFDLLDLTFNDLQDNPHYKKHRDKYSEPLIAYIGENQGEKIQSSTI